MARLSPPNQKNCIASERVFVHTSIYDEVCEKLVAVVEKMRMGVPCITNDPDRVVDCGAMTMEAQIPIIESHLADARAHGAKILCGGKPTDLGLPGATYFPPTLVRDVRAGMRLFQEETFGPVISLIKFENEADVIQMANSTPFHLGSSIYTNDRSRMNRMVSALGSEMMVGNDFGFQYFVQDMPFGGRKDSGFGRFNGPEGLREFSRTKSIVEDRFFWLRSTPPSILQYPQKPGAYSLMSAATRLFYGPNLLYKAGAAVDLFRVLLTGKALNRDLTPEVTEQSSQAQSQSPLASPVKPKRRSPVRGRSPVRPKAKGKEK